jgi:hypothetical protein
MSHRNTVSSKLSSMYNSDIIANYQIKKKRYPAITFFAFIYFFFNSFLLPSGLLYTILLTPWLMIWISKQNVSVVKVIGYFVLLFLLFFYIHSLYGVDSVVYLVSSLLYLSCIIFSVTFYTYINKFSYTFEGLLERLLKFNFFLVVVAVLSFPFWKENNIFWYSNEITESLKFPRLKLLTTESSAYSSLLAPLFFFYFIYFYHGNLIKKRFWLLITIIISLLLSLSYGTIGIIVITISIMLLYNNIVKRKSKNNKKLIIYFVVLIVLLCGFILGSKSGIATRALAILSGNDSSSKGRSMDAYNLAEIILLKKNAWFGIGPGQLKIIGKDIINNFYEYTEESKVVRIPSGMAEMLATFGYLGVITKLFLEIYFFFKTKVFKSSYRFCIFLFIFFFQFVGSNIVNTLEYVMWIIAFSNVFPDEYFKQKIIYKNG